MLISLSPTRTSFDPAEFDEARRLLFVAANPHPAIPLELRERAAQTVTAAWLRDVGRRLFDRAIPAPLAEALRADSAPLLLALDPALVALPWELLHDGSAFLARTRGIIRVAPTSAPLPTAHASSAARLRVLLALASPVLDETLDSVEDERQPTMVDLEREAALFRELDGAAFAADFKLAMHVTPDELDFALGDADVFHFVGHGGIGALLLENRDGTTHLLDAAWLRERFQNRALQLAVFQSCLTAVQPSPASGEGSVAQTLLEAGLPLVLAMTQSLSVAGARVFFERFYAELARGASVNAAAVSARRALADRPNGLAWEWATPALLARADAEHAGQFAFSTTTGSAAVRELAPRPPIPPLMTREQLFVGRRQELVKVARGLDPKGDGRVTLLHGEGGMGKTAIAIEAVHRWGKWFDTLIGLSARDVAAPREIVEHIVGRARVAGISDQAEFLIALGRALGLEMHGDELPKDALEPILVRLAARRRVLLVLDNLETLADAPYVLELLAKLPANARALVTSRRTLNVNEFVVPVRQMLPADAVQLLAASAAQKGLALTNAQATELYRGTGGHPMTMRLVIAQVTSGRATLDAALDDLRQAKGEVFDYVFGRSLELAGERARRVFALASLFAPWARRDALHAASGLPQGDFGDALAWTIALSLVESYANGEMLRLQELARAQARALLETMPKADVAAARLRAAEFYANFAYAMDDLVDPRSRRKIAQQMLAGGGRQTLGEWERALTLRALDAFDAEHENLRAAVQWAFDAQAWDAVATLVERQHEWQDLRALWAEREQNDLLAVEAAKREGNRAREGVALGNLGNVYQLQGRWAEAIGAYERALGVFRELGDRHGEGQTLGNLGNVYAQQGRWAEAIGAYEESLKIKRELGDRHGEATTLNNLGGVYEAQKDWDKALSLCQQSLEILLQLGDAPDVITVLRRLGWIQFHRSELDESFSHLARALSLALQIHAKLVADTLHQIIGLAKEIAETGKSVELARFGSALYGVVEQVGKQGWRDKELEAWGALCQEVCAVIALVGMSASTEVEANQRMEARAAALARAKRVDEMTRGALKLEEWVRGVVGG